MQGKVLKFAPMGLLLLNLEFLLVDLVLLLIDAVLVVLSSVPYSE